MDASDPFDLFTPAPSNRTPQPGASGQSPSNPLASSLQTGHAAGVAAAPFGWVSFDDDSSAFPTATPVTNVLADSAPHAPVQSALPLRNVSSDRPPAAGNTAVAPLSTVHSYGPGITASAAYTPTPNAPFAVAPATGITTLLASQPAAAAPAAAMAAPAASAAPVLQLPQPERTTAAGATAATAAAAPSINPFEAFGTGLFPAAKQPPLKPATSPKPKPVTNPFADLFGADMAAPSSSTGAPLRAAAAAAAAATAASTPITSTANQTIQTRAYDPFSDLATSNAPPQTQQQQQQAAAQWHEPSTSAIATGPQGLLSSRSVAKSADFPPQPPSQSRQLPSQSFQPSKPASLPPPSYEAAADMETAPAANAMPVSDTSQRPQLQRQLQLQPSLLSVLQAQSERATSHVHNPLADLFQDAMFISQPATSSAATAPAAAAAAAPMLQHTSTGSMPASQLISADDFAFDAWGSTAAANAALPPAPTAPTASTTPPQQQHRGPATAHSTPAPSSLPPPPSYDDVMSSSDDSLFNRHLQSKHDLFHPLPTSSSAPIIAASAQTTHDNVKQGGTFHAAALTSSGSAPKDLGPSSTGSDVKDQFCIEARLPPMKPKGSAIPVLMAGGLGSLFAAPALPGAAMLQWADAEGQLTIPQGLPRAVVEDMDAAPCAYVPLPDHVSDDVTALVVDEPSATMFTGHKGGRICRWSLSQGQAARVEHSWQAHQLGPVTTLAVTPWGDLWSGSAYGSVRTWAYCHGYAGPRPPVKLKECRRPNGGRPHSKLLAMALSVSGRVMWTAGRTSLYLWDGYTMECLGALRTQEGSEPDQEGGYTDPQKGIDPRLADRPNTPRTVEAGQDEEEDEAAAASTAAALVMKGAHAVGKFAFRLGKRIKQNIPTTTVDPNAVRKVDSSGPAASGSYVNDKGKVRGLMATFDGGIIVAYKWGVLEKYTELGRLLWEQELRPGISSICLVGQQQLWVGCMDGRLRVLDAASGEQQRCWQAHLHPIVRLAPCGVLLYSLARDGSIRGWLAHPPLDLHIAAYRDVLRNSLRRHQLRVLAGTWNVNVTRPAPSSIYAWLGGRADAADIVCVGLQEVEVGTSSVAMDAAFNVLYKSMLESGNKNAQFWATEVQAAIGHDKFVRVGLRQMSGILVLVFCRTALAPYVGEVSTASVACGLLGVAGNKGAVAVSMSVYRRRMIFVSSHFAAHQDKVEERNADYAKIVRNLRFQNTSVRQEEDADVAAPEAVTQHTPPVRAPDSPAVTSDDESTTNSTGGAALPSRDPGAPTAPAFPAVAGPGAEEVAVADLTGPGMRDAEALIWMGDFNYRINCTYQHAMERAATGRHMELLPLDQCREQMAKGAVFHGLSEGPINFPPTYKFEKNVRADDGLLLPYDKSEKARVPSWTDRILWRGSLPGRPTEDYLASVKEEDVVISMAGPQAYACVLDVCDSDHKPVIAELEVQLPAYIQEVRRRQSFHIVAALKQQAHQAGAQAQPSLQLLLPAALAAPAQRPGAIAATAPKLPVQPVLVLRRGAPEALSVVNSGPAPCCVRLAGEKAPRWHLPTWLEVVPASFLLKPGQGMRVVLRAQSPPPDAEATIRVLSQPVLGVGLGDWHASVPQPGPGKVQPALCVKCSS